MEIATNLTLQDQISIMEHDHMVQTTVLTVLQGRDRVNFKYIESQTKCQLSVRQNSIHVANHNPAAVKLVNELL